ncbi:hypothetical protein JB92DRAFT_2857713 [Gautieria morchelliformis]|nr:hypothetical protein JB92DRAFT_2857713 [Gautieria morchelliformis]
MAHSQVYRTPRPDPPQPVASSHEPVDSFMRPATHPNADETPQRSNALIADTLLDEALSLWESTAKKNRDIFRGVHTGDIECTS